MDVRQRVRSKVTQFLWTSWALIIAIYLCI